jgi:hypothetical protein
MESVTAALLSERFHTLPKEIQGKIAIEILLNHYEDTRKKICTITRELSKLINLRNVMERNRDIFNENYSNLIAEINMAPSFNTKERRILLERLDTKIANLTIEYNNSFHEIGILIIERRRCTQDVNFLRQDITNFAMMEEGEINTIMCKLEKIHLREFSEDL